MIDLKKLSALEKAAKPAPWYAWLKPVHTPDKCITTVPAEQFLCEYDEAEKFNAELRERIGRDVVSYEWKDRHLTSEEEVIGCSEWLHAENADLLLIVEMRNQLPDLIAYIDRLVAEIERLREKVHQRADRIAELEAEVKRLSQPNACDDWGNPVVLGVSGGASMSSEEYPVEHSFDIQAILIREDLIAELKGRVAELEKRNADLEARLGHEQVVTMQNREARLQGYIRDLGAQVTALKEIAVEGWAVAEFGGEQEGQDYHLYFRTWNIDRESYRKEALELLQAEHPEAFR